MLGPRMALSGFNSVLQPFIHHPELEFSRLRLARSRAPAADGSGFPRAGWKSLQAASVYKIPPVLLTFSKFSDRRTSPSGI